MDMFNFLPDSLLFIIVSFLPFKEAARTSILSKRWLHIWHATTNIDFSELFFVNPKDSQHTQQSHTLLFLNFIKHYIHNHHEPHVDTFSLKFSKASEFPDSIEHVVAFAFQRGVRELELDFTHPNDDDDGGGGCDNSNASLFHLPNHVYDYYDDHGGGRNLERLRLFSCGFLVADLMKYFVGLKDVCFGYMELKTCDVKNLLSHCGSIESLSLRKCWNLAHFDMGEENLRLTKLVIDMCDFHLDFLRFKAPNLRLFKYCGVVVDSEIVVNPRVMEEANLDFALEFGLDFGDVLYKLIFDLYPIRVLTVCSYFLQTIPNGEEAVRTQFDLNVRHLIMKTALHPNEFCGISFLLNSCPFLHTLTIHLGLARIFDDYEAPYNFDARRFWTEHAIYYECVRRRLKVVEVKGFRGSFNEILVLHYLVGCGRVLQNINIYLLEEDDHAKVQTHRTMANFLLTLPKASKNLQISIY